MPAAWFFLFWSAVADTLRVLASWHIVYNSKCNTIQSEEAIFFGSNSRLGTVWSFPNCVAPRRLFELRRATMKGLLANIPLVYFLYVRKSTDVEDKQVLSIAAQIINFPRPHGRGIHCFKPASGWFARCLSCLGFLCSV